MRLFISLLFAFSISAFCTPITDFAPGQVGNTWKYRVVFHYDHLFAPIRFDDEDFIRTFKLVKIDSIENSKIYSFEISDSGLRINSYSGDTLKDSMTINTHFSDTCSQIGDSIENISRIWYDYALNSTATITTWSSIRFIPFYKSHAIESGDSGMTKMLYKNDSLFQFTTYPGFQGSSYVQNVGLNSFGFLNATNTHVSCQVSLISYSILQTAISNNSPNFHIARTTRQSASNAFIFDLHGRRFLRRSASIMHPGLMINRGVNYLQVK